MVGGLTAFRNRAFTRALSKIIPSTYTFSVVVEYNHILEIFIKVNVAVIYQEIARITGSL